MTPLPRRVEFHEEGPREGFQMESQVFPLAQRVELIEALAATGLRQVQCASFVSPRAVPQMADSAELFGALRKRPGTRYTALWLNDNGFERARACERVDLDGKVMFYVTEPFSQRNNNCSVAQMRERQLGWIDRYIELGIPVEQAYIVTAFGCNFGGPVPVSAITDAVRWAGPIRKKSSAGSVQCGRWCRMPASACTCTTRVGLEARTFMLPCRWVLTCSTVRWPGWGAVPLPGTSTARRLAMYVPKTWCSCVRNWASLPASISNCC
jgi:hypothetical protein